MIPDTAFLGPLLAISARMTAQFPAASSDGDP
jgi:hypothetical protein